MRYDVAALTTFTPAADSDAPADERDEGESCEGSLGKSAGKEAGGFKWWHWAIAAGVVVAAGLAFWLLPVTDWLAMAIKWVNGLGWIGPAVFVAIYIPATILGAPATPLNIGAGLLFGVLWGAVASTVGATIGGVLSFLLARYFLQDWVQKKVDCYPTCDALLDRVEKEPWKFLLMLRAHPLLPAALKNYCLGTTEIRVWVFAVATFIACTPTRIVYAYLGSAGHMGLVGGDGDGKKGLDFDDWLTYGIGFGVSLVLTVALTWFVKRKLDAVKDD